jgi:hypothetical protein
MRKEGYSLHYLTSIAIRKTGHSNFSIPAYLVRTITAQSR